MYLHIRLEVEVVGLYEIHVLHSYFLFVTSLFFYYYYYYSRWLPNFDLFLKHISSSWTSSLLFVRLEMLQNPDRVQSEVANKKQDNFYIWF